MSNNTELNRAEEYGEDRSGILWQKPGKIHISVCRCLTCHMNHSDRVFEKMQKALGLGKNEWISKDELISFDNKLKSTGTCSRGVLIKVNHDYYSGMTEEKVERLVQLLRHEYGTLTIADILGRL